MIMSENNKFFFKYHGILGNCEMIACILTGFPFYIDFDEDDVISGKDLREVINRLTGEQALNDEEMEQLIQNVRKRGKNLT